MPDPVRLSYETIYTAPEDPEEARTDAASRRSPRDDAHRSEAHRGADAPGSRPLGGRPDHRQGQPLPGRHPGRTDDSVRRAGEAEQQQADVTAQAFTAILNRSDSQLRRSMIFDQG